MRIYFYSVVGEYIGNRLLIDDEEIPHNATLKPVEVSEDKIAFFDGSEWVLRDKPTFEGLGDDSNE